MNLSYPPPKKRVKKKMICEVDLFTAFPPPNISDRRVLGTPVQPIHRSEALTVLYVCNSLLLHILFKLHRF